MNIALTTILEHMEELAADPENPVVECGPIGNCNTVEIPRKQKPIGYTSATLHRYISTLCSALQVQGQY